MDTINVMCCSLEGRRESVGDAELGRKGESEMRFCQDKNSGISGYYLSLVVAKHSPTGRNGSRTPAYYYCVVGVVCRHAVTSNRCMCLLSKQ